MTGAPQWQLLEPLAATPVSLTWRVAVGGTLAVLRQDEPGAGRLGLNRAAEPDVIRRAATAGLGPACLFADPVRGLLLTAWLPGRAWSAADLQDACNLARAATLLRRVHTTPLAGPLVDLGAAIDRYAAAAGSGSADLAAAAREQLARALTPAGAPSGATPPLCFCHNDPTPGNFIASPEGQLQLIDWEYAGLTHPGFDLAGLALAAKLNRGQVDALLTAYRGRPPTRAEMTRHLAWEAVTRSLGELWSAALGNPPAGDNVSSVPDYGRW